MYNMMNGYGSYGMMGGWGGSVIGIITLVLFWALMIVAIAALWAWYKKNK